MEIRRRYRAYVQMYRCVLDESSASLQHRIDAAIQQASGDDVDWREALEALIARRRNFILQDIYDYVGACDFK